MQRTRGAKAAAEPSWTTVTPSLRRIAAALMPPTTPGVCGPGQPSAGSGYGHPRGRHPVSTLLAVHIGAPGSNWRSPPYRLSAFTGGRSATSGAPVQGLGGFDRSLAGGELAGVGAADRGTQQPGERAPEPGSRQSAVRVTRVQAPSGVQVYVYAAVTPPARSAGSTCGPPRPRRPGRCGPARGPASSAQTR
jgi:hypothetical protein